MTGSNDNTVRAHDWGEEGVGVVRAGSIAPVKLDLAGMTETEQSTLVDTLRDAMSSLRAQVKDEDADEEEDSDASWMST